MKSFYSFMCFLLMGVMQMAAQSDLPTFSTVENPVYYRIQFKTGGNKLQDNGNGEFLTVQGANQADGQLFALVGARNNFVLYSNKGNFVTMKNGTATNGQQANLFAATTTRAEATALNLINSNSGEGYFEITKSGDSSKGMNQWGGANSGVNLGLWNAGDTNNPLFFVDPKVITEYEVAGLAAYTPESKHTLWYNRPATVTNVANPWMEYSLPIGNGTLGASLFGGVKTDEIQFNEKTVWLGGPNDMGGYGKYLNFGNLYVKNLNDAPFSSEEGRQVMDYVRFLDIEKAVGGVDYADADGTRYSRRYFSSEPDGVIVVRYKSEGANKLNLLFSVKPGAETGAGNVTYTNDGYGYFSGKLTTTYQGFRFKVVPTGGELVRTTKGIEVKNASEVLLVMAGGTTFDSSVKSRTKGGLSTINPRVKKLVDDAVAKGWDALYADHVANHQSYMGRVDLNLNNARSTRDTESLIKYYNESDANKQTAEGLFLEQLYFHYGRYLHISSSRGPLHVPNNLQGIWNDKATAPWNSDIHTNINIQMNYWPAEPTNLSDGHLPFLNFIIDNAASDNWKRAAQRGGQTKGWTVFTESNIFGGMSTWGSNYFVVNAWYSSHLWQHYRYTLDRDFLLRAFPAMWSSAEFWMERMIKDRKKNDGTWVCPDEFSPEQHDNEVEDATAHAQQLVMDNLVNVRKAIDILGREAVGLTEAQVAKLDEYIRDTDTGLHIEEYKGDWGNWATNNGVQTGDWLLKEWKYTPYSVSKDKGHRHMSHLMCLYPLGQVNPGDDYYQPAVNALKLRGDEATGWSMGWKVNLWARAKDGDHARIIIKNALKHSTSYGTDQYAGGIYYNLYDSHAPFQIDGNFGVCAGIAELLVQSHNDVVEILPALPSAWKNGEVKGLKAIGDFTVDIAWANQKPTKVNIVSNKGANLRVSGLNLTDIEVLVDGVGAEVIAEEGEEGRPPVYQIRGVQAGQTIAIDATKPAVPVSIGLTPKVKDAASVYDLSGRRASSLGNGVKIVNGTKVIQ